MPLDLLRIPIFTLSIAHLDRLVRGADARLCRHPVPVPVGARPKRVRDRAPDDSVADRGRDRGAVRRAGSPTGCTPGCSAASGSRSSPPGCSSCRASARRPTNFDIAWRMAVCGLGFGLFQSPNNRTIVSAAPKPRSGAAGGMLATARLLGQTAGAVAVGVAFHLAGVRRHAAPAVRRRHCGARRRRRSASSRMRRRRRRAASPSTSRSSTRLGTGIGCCPELAPGHDRARRLRLPAADRRRRRRLRARLRARGDLAARLGRRRSRCSSCSTAQLWSGLESSFHTSPAAGAVLAFAILFVPSFLLVKLLARSLGGRTRRHAVLGPFDRVLGGGFGAAQGPARRDPLLPARQPCDRHGLRPAGRPAAVDDQVAHLSAAQRQRPRDRRLGRGAAAARQHGRRRQMIRLHDTHGAREARVRARRPEADHDVCLRPDGLRPRPHRQCAAGGGVRHARAADPPRVRRRTASSMPATSPTSTTRSSPRREAEGVDPSVITERYERYYLEDMGALGVAPPTSRRTRRRKSRR